MEAKQIRVAASAPCTDPFGAISQRCLENVMDVLAEPNAHLIGVYGSNHELKHTLIEKVCRRVLRDKLFDRVLIVTASKKPDVKKTQEEVTCQLRLTFNYKSKHDVKKIQEDIAGQLGLTFNNKSKDKRAHKLIERLKIEQKILIILSDLHKELDLSKVGIPYGSHHTGCKILLTSTTEDLLSNHMHTQHNFNIGS
ncbi:hypothetical protein QN277_005835 [Acacia crassicarpa]|uniref:NB-ARC domain-containing protein n=1 Tax=Acacia crassicarpa TaxID=499986 RepID=A0AAE1MGS4_9FABA|nr:hypothetical protein QN277_005835 [Acacia crassicarpa]